MTKKADYAFTPDDPDISSLYNKLSLGRHNYTLCHMSDAYTIKIATFCGIEVKSTAGSDTGVSGMSDMAGVCGGLTPESEVHNTIAAAISYCQFQAGLSSGMNSTFTLPTRVTQMSLKEMRI